MPSADGRAGEATNVASGSTSEAVLPNLPLDPGDTASVTCVPGSLSPCGEHPGLDGRGPCVAGQQECVLAAGATSTWGACTGSVGPAAADVCEVPGDDSDCDGVPNGGCPCVDGEVLPCGPATEEGVCQRGSSTCVEGAFSACVGAVFAARRACGSPADNDCDGRPDDTLDNVCTCALGDVQVCGEHPGQDGKGRCAAGSRTCVSGVDGATSAFGACQGSVGPASVESCGNSLDDDCNGETDEAAACSLCANNPCQNGGSCQPTPGGYSCTCRGFVGETCDEPLFELVTPAPGHAECTLYSLTDDGRQGGGVCFTPTPTGPPSEPVVWRSGQPFLVLPEAPSYYVSGDGAVLAESDRRSVAGMTATLDALNATGFDGISYYSALSVNRDGSVIAGIATRADFSSVPFRWSLLGGFELLPTSGAADLAAPVVSSDGSTVVGGDANGAYSFTTGAGLELIAPRARATGVSSTGSVVVGLRSSGMGSALFRWTAGGGAVDQGANCTAAFLSRDGSIIAAQCDDPVSQESGVQVWMGDGRASLVDRLVAAGATNVPPSLNVLWAMSGDGKTFVGQLAETDGRDLRYLWVARLP
jgi:EGF domain-containing protein